MSGFFDAESVGSGKPGDRGMLVAMALLAGVGIAALWSASSEYALSLGKESGYFALRQAIYLAPSLAAFWLFSSVNLEGLRRKTGLLVLLCFIFQLLPFIPGVGENRNGASRWVDLRFTTFQPSELWKLASVVYLAHILAKKKDSISQRSGVLIPPLMLVLTGCFLVYLQNDFSTAVIAGLCSLAVFWAAESPPSFFLGLGAAATPIVALSVLTSDFRLRRIIAFAYPAYEPHGQGYQVLGSIKAIRSGGFFGVGLGLGSLKRGSIPEVQSDFILAAWAEETGFLGVLAILALFGFIVYRAYRAAKAEADDYRSYLGLGLAFLLGIEALVNAAVAAGAIPATGIALPFFSAGGSSLFATAIACGLLYNLSKSSSILAEQGSPDASIFGREAADA